MRNRLFGRRDHDRRDNQKGKRVLQSASEVEQSGKLEHVVGKHHRAVLALQPHTPVIAQAQSEIQPGRH